MQKEGLIKNGGAYLLAVLGVLHGMMAVAAEPPRVKDSPIFSRFQERWTRALDTVGAPGFSVVVVKDNQVILLDGFGKRDVESGAPVTPDTMFYIASATKPFNAMAALALAEDGKLSLDAPVKQYLPQLELPDAELTSKLTPRDLMCHRYGINRSEIVFLDAYSGQITDEAYFRLLKKAEITHEVDYSNVHFTLLGRVIRAVSGQHWRDYLEARILKPAGMLRTTGYASLMYGDENVAYPHIEIEGKWRRSPVMKTDRTMHAAGGLGTTARDAGRWLRLNLNRGEIDGKRIVSSAGMEEMLKFQSKLPKSSGQIRVRQGFGLGWGRGTYRGRPYAFHGGGYVGTASSFSLLPEEGIGMAILVNSGGSGHGVADVVSGDIYDALLKLDEGDLLPAYERLAKSMRAKAEPAVIGDNLAVAGKLSRPIGDYIGTYRNADWGSVDVLHTDGLLSLRNGDLHGEMLSAGADAFLVVVEPNDPAAGRFIVKNDRVAALELEVFDKPVTFTRE